MLAATGAAVVGLMASLCLVAAEILEAVAIPVFVSASVGGVAGLWFPARAIDFAEATVHFVLGMFVGLFAGTVDFDSAAPDSRIGGSGPLTPGWLAVAFALGVIWCFVLFVFVLD